MVPSQLSIKILGLNFVNSVLDNNNWNIVNDKLLCVLSEYLIVLWEYLKLRKL